MLFTPLALLLLLSSPMDVEDLPDAVAPVEHAGFGDALGVDDYGNVEGAGRDDSSVDPFAPAERWADEPGTAKRAPTLPGAPGGGTPGSVPLDGGLGLLAAAGAAYAARRLRRRGAAVAVLALGLASAAQAQAPPLSPGDIAIISFDTWYDLGGPDLEGFAFVATVDLPAGAVVTFTNLGWKAAGGFLADGTAQSSVTYTVPAGGIAAGTVQAYRQNGVGTSAGFAPASAAFSILRKGGDQILAYQGTSAAPVFVYAVTNDPFGDATNDGQWDADATSEFTSALPAGLDNGSTARGHNARNNAYRGVSTGSRGDLLLAIGNLANWTISEDQNQPDPRGIPASFVVSGNAAIGAATMVGGPGWRLLAVPGTGVTVANLVGVGYVQGLPDEYPVGVQTNLYLGYNGYNADSGDPDAAGARRPNNLGFVAPFLAGDATPNTQEDVPLVPGRGFIWYQWDATRGPFAGAGGTSAGLPLPLLLPAAGTTLTTTQTTAFTTAERTAVSTTPGTYDDFFLLGNPFREALDLSGITKTAGDGTLQATFQFWNPNAGSALVPEGNGTPGSYVVRTAVADATNAVADDAQVWQGFFAEIATRGAQNTRTAPPTFSFDAAARVSASDPTFYGRGGSAAADSIATIAFTLAGTTSGGTPAYDEAAVLRFSADGALGWDAAEASKLSPFGDTWATLALVGPNPDGAPARLAQRSLPLALAGPVAVPLALTAAGEGGTYTLAWTLAGLPGGWAVTILDTATGATADLRTDASLAFASDTTSAERFVLTVTPDAATAGAPDAALATATVGLFAPNPAAGTSALRVRTGAGGAFTATLFDALGRRVRTVFEGETAPGQTLDLRLDTAGLARGVYVLRVDGAGVSEARRLTVVR